MKDPPLPGRPEGFTRSLSLYWGWRTQRLLTAKSAAAAIPGEEEEADADADADAASPSHRPHARGRFEADAQALVCEHWLEMADEKHRYGSNLLPYFEWWWKKRRRESGKEEDEGQEAGGGNDHDSRGDPSPPAERPLPPGLPRRLPSLLPRDGSVSALALDASERDAAARAFFAFLDGTPEGAALDLGAGGGGHEGEGLGGGPHGGGPPRAKLERERVRYLTAQERAELEVGVDGSGRLVYKRSGGPVHTRGGEQERTQRRRVVEHATAAAVEAAAEEDGAGGGGSGGANRGGGEAVARALAPFLSAEEGDAPGSKDEAAEAEEGRGGTRPASNKPCKWIWVLDRQRRLYVHAKRRGAFHHSSFLEGGEVLSAGGVDADGGRVLRLTADSGHYRPSLDNFMATVSLLRDWGADLSGAVLSAKHLAAPEAEEEEQHHQRPAAVPLAAAADARARSLGALRGRRFTNSVLLESAVEAALAATEQQQQQQQQQQGGQ